MPALLDSASLMRPDPAAGRGRVCGEASARDGKLTDEAGRLSALLRYAILDTQSEAPFEKVASLVKCLLRFKSINDTYGHPTGDAVLRAVAECCKGALRGQDAFGRLGGEEFGILLAGVETGAALATATRLRQAIAALAFEGEPGFGVTASFGIAPLQGPVVSVEGWTASADVALYAAKHAGRNCSRVAGQRDLGRAGGCA